MNCYFILLKGFKSITMINFDAVKKIWLAGNPLKKNKNKNQKTTKQAPTI